MWPFSRAARAGLWAGVLCGLLIAAPACDDGPVIPPRAFQPVGTWNAVIFTATVGTQVHDLLELGGFISLTLRADNTLGGTYAVPEFEDQPSDEFPITGTWTLQSEATVRFEHFGDSYLRRLPFVGGGNEMIADGVVDGIAIRIVLER